MSNVTINILTTISLIWILALIVAVIVIIAVMIKNKDTAKLYGFLKKFKKGSCFLVYFAAIPLYFCALYYGGATISNAIFSAIENSISLIVLSFGFDALAPLISINSYYTAVVYICFIAVILNAVLFAASLAGMRLMNFIYRHKALHQKENVYIIVGYNENNKKIIESVSKKDETKRSETKKKKDKYSLLLVSEKDMREKEALNLLMIENKAAYAEYEVEEFSKTLERLAGKRKLWQKRAVNIIINSENDSENLLLTQELSKFLNNHKDIKHDILNRDGINGYVFCAPKDVSTFNYYVESTHGAIQYLNKYRLVAMDFITNYPLTRYMTDEIDERYPALKEDVDVNFIMIGFGKLNRQLFHTSVSTQQYLGADEYGNITEKPIHYCIYDKTDSNADLVLNHNYYRYSNFLEMSGGKEDDFLPLPNMPANVQFHKIDIRDGKFYKSLYSDLNGKNKYSYIVISYGTDMENLDFGQKLSAKLKEWNLSKVKLFVKIRNYKLVKDINNEDMIFFGDEGTVVYNVDAIMHEKIESLAKKRNWLYAKEGNKGKDETAINRIAIGKWYRDNSQCQREANIYTCMSLRSKLNLLGFDIREKGNDSIIAKNVVEEFMTKYQSGYPEDDPIVRDENGRDVEYKNADFDRNSVRKYCAVIEHQRWNANYISWGFVPATKHEIATCKENGKNFAIRRHGCLTTFEGLKDFRKIVAKRNIDFDPCAETLSDKQKMVYELALEDADVIRYDYQIMDDAVWLLENSGYELVKIKKAEKQ